MGNHSGLGAGMTRAWRRLSQWLTGDRHDSPKPPSELIKNQNEGGSDTIISIGPQNGR